MRQGRATLFAGLIISGAAFCQDSPPSAGPMLGLVFDRAAKGVRPIWGIPGSAFYGPPLALGFDVARAAVAQNNALAVSTDGSVFFARMNDGAVSARPIDAPPSPDSVAISSNAASAALYYRDHGSIALLTLGDQPVVTSTFPAPGALSGLAISDDGKALACIETSDAGSTLVAIDAASGAPRNIAQAGHIAAAAFLPGTQDVVYADDNAGAVSLVRALLADAVSTPLLAGDERMPAPGAIQPSSSGAQVIVAGPKDGSVGILDLAGGDPVFMNCNCTPGNLARLLSKSLYVLTEFQDGVIWLLDSSTPRVLFVPPETDSASGVQQ